MSDSSSKETSSSVSPDRCKPEPDSKFVTLDPYFMLYYFGIFGLVMLVNLTGNWLVLRTIYRHRCLWAPSNTFICSLAVSDFLFGLAFPVYNVAGINRPAVTEVLGSWEVCRIILMEVVALEICSAYALVAITVTRFIATSFPLRHHQIVTMRNCLVVIVMMWVISHVSCIFVYAVRQTDAVATGNYCKVCRFERIYTASEMMVLTVVQFVLPLALMLTFYLRMACIARKLNNRVTTESMCTNDIGSELARASLNQRRQKSFVVISTLIGCFVLSYLPLVIYFVIVIPLGQPRNEYEYLSATVRIFLFLNTAVNVFIYAGRMSDFRDHLRRDIAALRRSAAACCAATSQNTSTRATSLTSRHSRQEKGVKVSTVTGQNPRVLPGPLVLDQTEQTVM